MQWQLKFGVLEWHSFALLPWYWYLLGQEGAGLPFPWERLQGLLSLGKTDHFVTNSGKIGLQILVTCTRPLGNPVDGARVQAMSSAPY